MPGSPGKTKVDKLIRQTFSIRPEHSREIDAKVKDSYGELSRSSVVRRALDSYLLNRINPTDPQGSEAKGARK